MPYTLVWTTQARDKSARLWISFWLHDATMARRFTTAVNWIDQQLQQTPQIGHRHRSELVLRHDPIEVFYTYSQLDYSVTITDIDLCGPSAP